MLNYTHTEIKILTMIFLIYLIYREVSEIERLVEKIGVEVLSARDQHGYTPAHWAALDGSVAVMRYLVERGAPIDLSCLGTQVTKSNTLFDER